jgi:stress response protein YsnF
MSKVVVGMFATRPEAERAAQDLMDAGYERGEIEIRSQDSPRSERADESGSWWDWLFGESEDRRDYTEGFERGGAILRVTTTDERADYARMLLEGEAEHVETSRAGGMAAAPAPARGAETRGAETRGGEEEVIPVIEERVKVGTRPVTRGGVRVYARVTERPVEEDVRLRDERVHVERRPADRPVSATDEAFRDRTVELTETDEEAVVAKEARVVEDVVVGREIDERVETVRESVRRTDVDVEHLGRDDDDFRRHWTTNYQTAGTPYETYAPAYSYGTQLGADPRYAGRDWATIETDARQDWEQRNPGTWERFKDSIRYAWDTGRGTHRRAA